MTLHPIPNAGAETALAAGSVDRALQKAPGTGVLRFVRSGSRTVLQRTFATSPLKILNPRTGGGAAWAYTATYGGGLVGGDAIRIAAEVGPGARAVCTTQSATKVYRSTVPASHQMIGRVHEGALLVVAPDPTVCFAGSVFRQEQRYALMANASLVVVDWMTSGRRAMGERWAFDRYGSLLDVSRDGRRILYDSLLLAREDGPIGERMGRFDVWATLVLLGPLVEDKVSTLIATRASLPIQRQADVIVSAASLENDGALLRMAGQSVEEIGTLLREHLSFLRPHLGEAVWGRKW